MRSYIQENKTQLSGQDKDNQTQDSHSLKQTQSQINNQPAWSQINYEPEEKSLLISEIRYSEKSQHSERETDNDLERLQFFKTEYEQPSIYLLQIEDNIHLSPNGTIILGKNFNELQLSSKCTILQYEQKAFKLPYKDNPKKIYSSYYKYIGQMDPYGEYFQGQGRLTQLQIKDEVHSFEGNFNKGQAIHQCRIQKSGNEIIHAQFQEGIVHGVMETFQNGNLISKENYRNGKIISNQSFIIEASQILFISKDIYITTRIFKTLMPGQWLNQKIIDAYMTLAINDILLMQRPNESKYQNIIITPSQFQDIFSSQLTISVKPNQEQWDSILKKFKKPQFNQQNKRYIFMINHQRCHFLVIVKEEDTLYELNSLGSFQQQIRILPIFSKCLRQIPEMDSTHYGQSIKVSQQTNDYDCGIYCIDNTIKLLQNPEISVTKINFKDFDKKKSKLMRKHIRNVILDNYHNYIL